jgi:phage gpG-like protein
VTLQFYVCILGHTFAVELGPTPKDEDRMSYGAFEADLQKELVDRLNRAGLHLVSEIRTRLNVSQPYKRSGLHFRGLDPSRRGEFPRKLSGQLLKSIASTVDAQELVAIVGTALPHGKFLEFGTTKMAARPWLYRTYQDVEDQLARILVG